MKDESGPGQVCPGLFVGAFSFRGLFGGFGGGGGADVGGDVVVDGGEEAEEGEAGFGEGAGAEALEGAGGFGGEGDLKDEGRGMKDESSPGM